MKIKNVGLGLLVASAFALSGCVHQITSGQATALNNYLLVDCAAGGELKYGSWPARKRVGDRAGVCAQEISKRVESGRMNKEELALNMQRVQMDAANERSANIANAICASRPWGCY